MASDLRTSYFDAALGILATQGYGGLKQAALCRAMGVTTGAFYHSFSSWKDFTGQFLEYWHVERTTRLVVLAEQRPDPLDRLESLVHAAGTLPHQAESAIRVWSALDPEVAAFQARVDRERFDVIYDAFLELLGDSAEAERYAQAGMYVLIGFEQQRPARDPESLTWCLQLIKAAAGAARRDRVPRTPPVG